MNKIALYSLCVASLALAGCDHMPSWMGGGKKEIARAPGEREALLPPGQEFTPDATLKDVPVSLPQPVQNSDWPQHSGVFTSANSHLALTGDSTDVSSASAGDGEEFPGVLIPRPVVAQGMVFAMDGVGNISAREVADIGNLKWQSAGVSEDDTPETIGGGLAYDQGRLYALSGRGVMAAFDAATGQTLWKKNLRRPFRSAPRVSGGKLVAMTIDNETLAFDAATGAPLWNHQGIAESSGFMTGVSPTIAGDVVIAPYSSGELYALSLADGHVLWDQSLMRGQRTLASAIFAGIGGDPVVDGRAVVAVSGNMLMVIDLASGQRIWDKPVGSLNTPWVSGDYLFVLTSDNTLVAYVKYDGRVRWSTRLASFEDEERKLHPIAWSGPLLVNGKLAVVSSKGELKLISAASGEIVATHDVADDIYTPPVVAAGRMVLINKSATLYSLQ